MGQTLGGAGVDIFCVWHHQNTLGASKDVVSGETQQENPCDPICDQIETCNQFFFSCATAISVRDIAGLVLGTSTCPDSVWQCYARYYF